jgi:hypothetical protein
MSYHDEIGRLALRVEGDFWNAYYALSDTMEDAVFLGSVAMAAVQDPERKAAFMALMREFVADILEAQTGERPFFGVRPAPHHERGGQKQ